MRGAEGFPHRMHSRRGRIPKPWFWRRSFLPFFRRRKKGSRRRHMARRAVQGDYGLPRARSALAMTPFARGAVQVRAAGCGHPALWNVTRSAVAAGDREGRPYGNIARGTVQIRAGRCRHWPLRVHNKKCDGDRAAGCGHPALRVRGQGWSKRIGRLHYSFSSCTIFSSRRCRTDRENDSAAGPHR